MPLRTDCIMVTYSYANFSPNDRPTIIRNPLERVLSKGYSVGFATLAGENQPSHLKLLMLFHHRRQIPPALLAQRILYGGVLSFQSSKCPPSSTRCWPVTMECPSINPRIDSATDSGVQVFCRGVLASRNDLEAS